MHYAIIENGVVVNVALADSPIDQHWIATEVAGIGWTWDGQNFFAPSVPAAAPTVRDLTPVQYLKRFTQAERIAIRAAAASNPVVNDYLQLMNAVTDVVHLDDPDTVAGLNAMEAAGLIGTGRAAAIRA